MSIAQDAPSPSLTWEEAQGAFGPPAESDVFPLAPELPEFRNALPDLAGSDAVTAKTEVREATWPLNDAQNRTIWFMQADNAWRYLHHYDWDKGLEF